MLHEEQIDLRRQRARAEAFQIENVGKKRVFSDFRVRNPKTRGQYTVTIRGFDVGENFCTCPDFKANTLGTCKHIEAVLESLKDDTSTIRQRKAIITRPEITLHYRDQPRLRLHLPPRCSDALTSLGTTYFDSHGLWLPERSFSDLLAAIDVVPEKVTVTTDALDFIDRELEQRTMAEREKEWLAEVDNGSSFPTLLNVPLYDYQLRGAIWIACRGRGILGDDMGLGKTIQALAAIELLANERGLTKVLIIAPASVKYQWADEIRKFTSRSAQIIEGLQPVRLEAYQLPTFYRLVNYEQVVRDLDALNAWGADAVILDEAQRIKNWESKTSKAVKKLRSRYALVLTGTPLENKLEELYSIVQFVDDRRLGPAFAFLHEHRVLDAKGNLTGYRNLDSIREKLAPILLRRTRGEVLSQLPARTDNTIIVEMRDEQRVPYEAQRSRLAQLLQKKALSELDRRRILACLVNMRMLCDSTFLFDKETTVSPKLDEFTHIIEELAASGDEHKAVVFSQWETMLHQAGNVLTKLGVGFALLHGGMAGKDRKAVLDRFRGDPTCRVFLSTDAGGVGLNLQSADTVVNLELPWNPAVLEQRIARVHRMGQERPVRVVNFITRGSIEERVQKVLEAKMSLFVGLFEGDGDRIDFAAVGQPSFLHGVRELVGEERGALPKPETQATKPDILEAAVTFLEALAAWEGELPGTSPLKSRAADALKKMSGRVDITS